MPYHDKCPICSDAAWTTVLGGFCCVADDIELDHIPVLPCSCRPEPLLHVHSEWTIPKFDDQPSIEFGAFCYGPLFSSFPVVDSKNTISTMYGVVNRSYSQLRPVDSAAFEETRNFITNMCSEWDVKCDGLDTYFSKLRPEQKKKMKNAVVAFKSLKPHLTLDMIREMSQFVAFGKRELLTKRMRYPSLVGDDSLWASFHHAMWSGDWAVEPHSIRAIQHLTPLSNCLTGPAVQSMYQAAKKHLGLMDDMTLGSGYNATEIGVWMTNVPVGWRLYEADASKYDGHQQPEWFDMLSNILKKMRHAPWWVGPSVDAQKDAPTKLRDGTKLGIIGTMKSGSTFTTLLNSLVNVGILRLASKLAGVPPGCSKFIVAGDDSVFAVDPRYDMMPYIQRAGELLGHELKVKETDLTGVKFLSSYFSPIIAEETKYGTSEFKLTPEPARMLTKFGWSLDFQPSPSQWLKECSQAASAVYSGVPGFEHIFGQPSVDKTAFLRSENRKVDRLSKYRDDSRVNYRQRYGIDAEDLDGTSVSCHRAIYDPVFESVFAHAGY
jgi:hypothetical protein